MQSLLTREHVFSNEQTVPTDYKVKLIGLKPKFVRSSAETRGQGLVTGCKKEIMDTEPFFEL